MVLSLSLGVLRYTDWRAQLDPYVMASDASETGRGFVIARRLSSMGIMQAMQDAPRKSAHCGVVVLDFFAGIGDLLRSLERAGLSRTRVADGVSDGPGLGGRNTPT